MVVVVIALACVMTTNVQVMTVISDLAHAQTRTLNLGRVEWLGSNPVVVGPLRRPGEY